MRRHTFLLGLFLTTVPVAGLACNAHPAEVSHSEWAWMQQQRDPKTNKVETTSKDFFNSKPAAQNQNSDSGNGGDRPIRYVK